MYNTPEFIARLKSQLSRPLPGATEQLRMAPDPKHYYDRVSDDYRKAAVLALLYPVENRLHLVYIKRSSGDANDKHAGQISFPGGKLEQTDKSLEECALRETNEEVGVLKENINVLGQLSKVFVFVSNFMVYPFIGYAESRPNFIADDSEVEQILEIPLEYLLETKNQKVKDLKIRNYLLKDVPYYSLNGHVLWGATAMMTSELLYLIKKSKK